MALKKYKGGMYRMVCDCCGKKGARYDDDAPFMNRMRAIKGWNVPGNRLERDGKKVTLAHCAACVNLNRVEALKGLVLKMRSVKLRQLVS